MNETCLGESDTHRRWKTIAYDKVKAVFEESHGLDNIYLDNRMVGPYRPDVLAVFSEPDERLGRGVAVEVQYKNPDKDVVRVQRAYLLRGFSVIWLTE